MRQIKFRVWNKDISKWEDNRNLGYILSEYSELDDCLNKVFDNSYPELTFQQFTGLEDRNGKEIYEGDIIQVLGAGKYAVVWDRYFFNLDNYDQYSMDNQFSAFFDLEPQEMTVIGNIFENPDLILQNTPS